MRLTTTILLMLYCSLAHSQDLGISYTDAKNDGSSLSLGLKFKPSAPSVVAGVKFYRLWSGGQITGQLWSSTGSLLGSVNIPGDDMGWRSAYFPAPITVQAGVEYVVSYFSAGGGYVSAATVFPRPGKGYAATGSAYRYAPALAFPVNNYGGVSYGVEPIIQDLGIAVVKDTVWRDTCDAFSWQRQTNLQFTLLLAEEGGKYCLPDSTTIYTAVYGSAPPHLKLKDDPTMRVHRFTHSFVSNGITTKYRFTLYKTGSWIREQQQPDGSWKIILYPTL